jgi:hypothetical protein
MFGEAYGERRGRCELSPFIALARSLERIQPLLFDQAVFFGAVYCWGCHKKSEP